jgi:hypothetical protein
MVKSLFRRFANGKLVFQLPEETRFLISIGKIRHKKRAAEVIRRSMAVSGSFCGSFSRNSAIVGVLAEIVGVSGSFMGVP